MTFHRRDHARKHFVTFNNPSDPPASSTTANIIAGTPAGLAPRTHLLDRWWTCGSVNNKPLDAHLECQTRQFILVGSLRREQQTPVILHARLVQEFVIALWTTPPGTKWRCDGRGEARGARYQRSARPVCKWLWKFVGRYLGRWQDPCPAEMANVARFSGIFLHTR